MTYLDIWIAVMIAGVWSISHALIDEFLGEPWRARLELLTVSICWLALIWAARL